MSKDGGGNPFSRFLRRFRPKLSLSGATDVAAAGGQQPNSNNTHQNNANGSVNEPALGLGPDGKYMMTSQDLLNIKLLETEFAAPVL